MLCLAVTWDTMGRQCSRRCYLAMCRVARFSVAPEAGSMAGVWQPRRRNRVENPLRML